MQCIKFLDPLDYFGTPSLHNHSHDCAPLRLERASTVLAGTSYLSHLSSLDISKFPLLSLLLLLLLLSQVSLSSLDIKNSAAFSTSASISVFSSSSPVFNCVSAFGLTSIALTISFFVSFSFYTLTSASASLAFNFSASLAFTSPASLAFNSSSSLLSLLLPLWLSLLLPLWLSLLMPLWLSLLLPIWLSLLLLLWLSLIF